MQDRGDAACSMQNRRQLHGQLRVPSLARCPLTGVCDAAAAGRSWAMELRLVAYKHERGSL